MSKKALLIAGTGTMGVHVTRLLMHDDYECWVTSRSKHEDKEKLHYIQGNPHDITFLKKIILLHHWETIVDFTYYSVTEISTIYNLLLLNTDLYVFLSSARVYADYNGFIHEDCPRLLDVCNDTDYIKSDEYAIAKAKEEDFFITGEQNNWIIVRPYITYGENTFQLSPIRKEFWLTRALKKKKIYFAKELANKVTTFTYGYDVARSIVALIHNKTSWGGIYNITNYESLEWAEILTIYLNTLELYIGKRPSIYMEDKWNPLMTGTYDQVKYDRLYNRRFDCTKLSRYIDIYSFTSTKDGIEKCLKLYLNSPHGYENINMAHEAQVDRITNDWEPLRQLIQYPFIDILKYMYYRLK